MSLPCLPRHPTPPLLHSSTPQLYCYECERYDDDSNHMTHADTYDDAAGFCPSKPNTVWNTTTIMKNMRTVNTRPNLRREKREEEQEQEQEEEQEQEQQE